MNDFLSILSRSLKHMSKEEKNEILQDYQEHFEIGLASGKTEFEVAISLGDPVQLAKMYTAMGATRTANNSKRLSDALHMIGAIARYRVVPGLLMGALYFACLTVLFILFGFAVSFVLAGGASLIYMVIMIAKGLVAFSVFGLFLALVMGCGGLLGMNEIVKLWRLSIAKLPAAGRSLMKKNTEQEF